MWYTGMASAHKHGISVCNPPIEKKFEASAGLARSKGQINAKHDCPLIGEPLRFPKRRIRPVKKENDHVTNQVLHTLPSRIRA